MDQQRYASRTRRSNTAATRWRSRLRRIVGWGVRITAASFLVVTGVAGATLWSTLQEDDSRRGPSEEPATRLGASQANGPAPVVEPPRRPGRLRASPDELARQARQYQARVAKTVVELQPGRTTQTGVIRDGERSGTAELINLNPEVNRWYVLRIAWADDSHHAHHLENTRPEAIDLQLDPTVPNGLLLASAEGLHPCPLPELIGPGSPSVAGPYTELCDGDVLLRSATRGHRTRREWAAEFLRDHVWGGEELTSAVKTLLYKDAFLDTAQPVGADQAPVAIGGPRPGQVDAVGAERGRVASRLGLVPQGVEVFELGRWYPVDASPGVYVSLIEPGRIHGEILASHRDRVHGLDRVERAALAYLVAFDLDAYQLGFGVGTEHPRIGWSDRASHRGRAFLPGPDGVDDATPLVPTGMIPEHLAALTIATFTGGFKREHGAFRFGELASVNDGTHYGFIEAGVVLSKLQPELATVLVDADGQLEFRTWPGEDPPGIERIAFARQNGVPILEPDPSSGEPAPGRRVNQWGPGNWSGSQQGDLRTVRAGIALQTAGRERYLIYGYFSSATPSAMARVFQAYDCDYAMHLDMNALEHTYLALYRSNDGQLQVDHLVEGMEVLDQVVDGVTLPRFVALADNRDFFYLTRRQDRPGLGTADLTAGAGSGSLAHLGRFER